MTTKKLEDVVERMKAAIDNPAIKAHYTMGTYSTYGYKTRSRDLTEDEVKKIYGYIRSHLKDEKMTEDIAKEYRITRIRAMGYLAAYKRSLNKKR